MILILAFLAVAILAPLRIVAQDNEGSNKFPSVFVATETKPAKMANKFLKMIANQKYVKAQEYKADIFQKSLDAKKEKPKIKNTYMDAMYPLWEIGNAILLYKQAPNDEDGIMVYNPKKAYDIFSGVVRKGTLWNETVKYFANKDNNVDDIKLNVIQEEMETLLVEEAKKQNTANAFDTLYNKLLENSKYKAEIYGLYEQLLYDKIVKQPTLDDYNKFLSVFPNSKHFDEVTVWRDSLHIEEMGRSVKSCDVFLSLYPKSKFVDKVQRIREVCASADIEANGTLADCKEFFDRYPNSEYQQRIQDRVLALMVQPEVTLKDYHEYENSFGSHKDERVVKAFEQLKNLETHWQYLGYSKPVKTVTEKTITKSEDYEVVYQFNDNGLVTSADNAKFMTNDTYNYEFVKKVGWHIKSCQHKTPRSEMIMTYVYDSNNYLTAKNISNGATIEYESSMNDFIEKEYTSRRRLQVTRTFDFAGRLQRSDNMDGNYTLYSYNSAGLLDKETTYQGNSAAATYTFSYEMNQEGDWTRRDKLKNGDVVQTVTRDIVYAE